MATVRQLEIIADIEAACAAVAAEKPDKVTLGLIGERAGIYLSQIRQTVEVLRADLDVENLARMKRAFMRAGKVPEWLEDVETENSGSRRSHGDHSLPPSGSERRALAAQFEIDSGIVDDGDPVLSAVNAMVKTLAPLSHSARLRVIGTTSVYFGISSVGGF